MTVAKSGIPVTIQSTMTQTIFLQTAATANVQATTTPFKFITGLSIDIIARILDGGLIDMNLNPALSTVTGQSQAQPGTTGTVPIISTRSTTANVTVRSGQAAVIGGILQDGQTFTQNGLRRRFPVLGTCLNRRITSISTNELHCNCLADFVPAASQRTDRFENMRRALLTFLLIFLGSRLRFLLDVLAKMSGSFRNPSANSPALKRFDNEQAVATVEKEFKQLKKLNRLF